MKSKYKIGDITKNGWEIIDVDIITVYTKRKRIMVNNNYEEYAGKKGWLYSYERTGAGYCTLDDYDNNRQFRFRENEIDYI